MQRNIFIIGFLIIFSLTGSFAQTKPDHEKINDDIYEVFSSSYINSDFDLFTAIHSKDIVRINIWSGVQTGSQYPGKPGKNWTSPDRPKRTIDFRLIERISSESHISDRGIYKVANNPGTSKERVSYGKFHVLLRLERGKWKIIMDYDESAELEAYEAAFGLSDHESYYKKTVCV